MFYHLALAVAAKISFAKFAWFETAEFSNRAGQAAFIQRNARQNSHPHTLAEWKQILLRRLIEDVVNNLDGIEQTGFHGFERRIRIVLRNRDAEIADLPASAQIFHRAAPLFRTRPGIRPHVKLLQINLLDAQITQTVLRRANDVVTRKHFLNVRHARCWPYAIFAVLVAI